MTNEELKRIAGKIAKLLALSTSDNPTEAETAKRQAQAMMDKYNLTTGDVAAAQVHEQPSKTGSNFRPPLYLCKLGGLVAKAFGCEIIISPGGGFVASEILFLGLGIKPELAAYTFDVLRRQITKDRSEFTATLKRYKRENRIRKADVFCEAWILRVRRQVANFAGTEQEKAAIAAYKEQRWGGTLTDDTRKRREAKPGDADAFVAGANAAKDVSIHKPVQAKRQAMLS